MVATLWKPASAASKNKNINPVPTFFELAEMVGTVVKIGITAQAQSMLPSPMTNTLSVSSVSAMEAGNTRGWWHREVPARSIPKVDFEDLVQSTAYQKAKATLKAAVGLDADKTPVVLDVAQGTPMLVVGVNSHEKKRVLHSLICSVLLSTQPEEVQLMLIDVKMRGDFHYYQRCRHLWKPVITSADKAIATLQWQEMEIKTRLLKRSKKVVEDTEQENIADRETDKPLVLVIAEIADLIVEAGRVVEKVFQRIIRKASSVGIHIIVGTQCPEVVPAALRMEEVTRCVFQVFSQTDSVAVLGVPGAENLQGIGDGYLKLTNGDVRKIFVPEMGCQEIIGIVEAVKRHGIDR